MTTKTIVEGPISKWTNVVQGWQCRWFVLDQNQGLFSYYTSKAKMKLGVKRGCIRLFQSNLGLDDDENNIFTVTDLVTEKTFHFMTKDKNERNFWIKHIEECMQGQKVKTVEPVEKSDQNTKKFSSSSQTKICDNAPQPKPDQKTENLAKIQDLLKIMDLEKDLTPEKFAQNQQELKILKSMIESTVKNDLPMELQQKFQKEFNLNLSQFFEGLDQTIDDMDNKIMSISEQQNRIRNQSTTLEITDNSKILNATTQNESRSNSIHSEPVYSKTSMKQTKSCDSIGSKSHAAQNLNLVSQSVKSTQSHCVIDKIKAIDVEETPLYSFSSGDESYSETESESEEFYDAEENSKSHTSMRKFSDQNKQNNNNHSNNLQVKKSAYSTSEVKQNNNQKIDFMSEFDSDDDQDIDMNKHKNMISFLISQVRIGMDLTRISLPTFILEHRSLLEMYASFFSHPAVFSEIPDFLTPQERILGVLKWYLSSFHVARKSPIAKKPYNPILGEVFQCLFSEEDNRNFQETNSNQGNLPLPWAKNSDIQFIAEQVSHHPPISAFYAENPSKNIQFTGHIYTKSKFLGLSICVNNIGQGNVSILSGPGKNEEYLVSFPTGYGRSILSVPWIELGGECSIFCPQTGYYCSVNFLTKPFYGGKLHKVEASLYAPKKDFNNNSNISPRITTTTTKILNPELIVKGKKLLTIEGEWNGSFEVTEITEHAFQKLPKTDPILIKYGEKQQKSKSFVNTKDLKINRPFVRDFNLMADNESRILWKNVTKALRNDNVDLATEEKLKLEQKQRADRAMREKNNEKWETKLFKKVDECWVFGDDLKSRMKKGQL